MEAPLKAFYGNEYLKGISNGAAARADVESIIIDLRGNPGGSLSDISPAIGSLMQDHFHWGYTRYKQGPGRYDYTGWEPLVFTCPKNHLATAKPIVVLSDVSSVSCSELSTYILKSIPNGYFIGEKTFGGTCALSPNTDITFNIYYSGCFGDQKLYEKRVPTHAEDFAYFMYSGTYKVVTSSYESLEGVGVEPDKVVPYNKSELEAGVDNQLNSALQYLRNGK
jgi:C-terminal processing protease CtpA/Prc